ncbi:sarcolemmal membrane-associated protein [Vespa velutina]|uniref:sarcolemmal membrane-associated protein n=1 Tax=Vespa velutina TaxID=202808 RepID=UPI001FB34A12|nr:sarcolemmal membrane-associated protein [Vespa velutina]XP_047370915.1 sarcolemmal membrane-associated protein [Vespa velutina]XP_047370916.1 sarcolemmal membrane-associated protein [Vespa velutina]
MVVASGGWVQNANYPAAQNNNNLSLSNMQDNKMAPKVVLICRDNSHPFQERTLTLEEPVKIGRSVARVRAAPNNAIFDCRVLSRNHALLWYTGGKFYLQDTRSSNGTFINNQRLSTSGLESAAEEVCSGDIVQFGVDVVENTKKVTHGCIVATIKLYLPDGKEAKASLSTSVTPVGSNVSLEDLYKLYQVIQEASRREKALNSKLGHLQQLVENIRKVTNQSWKALITEDRLLSWVETVENQLVVYSKNYTEDKIRNELVKLQEEKAQYQNTAKEALQKILQEKLEIAKRLVHVETQLSETEEENQSLHSVSKYTQNELQELSVKYTEVQKKLQETTNKLLETEEKLKVVKQNAEQEIQVILKTLERQEAKEQNLLARLQKSRLSSVNILKQITALRNYMQTLQDMDPKLVTSENFDSKDGENPIDAINAILNKLNSISAGNIEMDSESNFKEEQDNQFNLQDIDSNQLKVVNSESFSSKEKLDDLAVGNDNLTEYILPPPSRRTLVNGNANLDNLDINSDADIDSDATDETCSVASDDVSIKSTIENKKEEHAFGEIKEIFVPHKAEVRFASNENGEQLEVYYEPTEQTEKENELLEKASDTVDSEKSFREVENITTEKYEQIEEKNVNEKVDLNKDCDDEDHLEGDYIKTLKPMTKNESMQQSLHSKEYILHTLIGSLDSLKGEDSLEAQQVVKQELEELRDSLIHEPTEIIMDRLKELYYRAKNEAQRMQEVNEELVIVKEKYNAFLDERGELLKKYTTLKQQCGDLLNATYTVPIHYVVPIVIALVCMLLEKIF